MSDDTKAVAQGLEALCVAAEEEKKQSPNLPLPRKLRDRIYAFLLHHQHVQGKAYHIRDRSKRTQVC